VGAVQNYGGCVNLLCVEIVRAMGGAEDPRGGCERAGGTCGVKMGAAVER
jgi:hypothetical protein